MMTNINILESESHNIEFDMKISGGVLTHDTRTNLIIKLEGYSISIPAMKSTDSDKWILNIPSNLPLSIGEYPYSISVVYDGHYFEPTSGMLVVGEPPGNVNIDISEPKISNIMPKDSKYLKNDSESQEIKNTKNTDKLNESSYDNITGDGSRNIQDIIKNTLGDLIHPNGNQTVNLDSTIVETQDTPMSKGKSKNNNQKSSKNNIKKDDVIMGIIKDYRSKR